MLVPFLISRFLCFGSHVCRSYAGFARTQGLDSFFSPLPSCCIPYRCLDLVLPQAFAFSPQRGSPRTQSTHPASLSLLLVHTYSTLVILHVSTCLCLLCTRLFNRQPCIPPYFLNPYHSSYSVTLVPLLSFLQRYSLSLFDLLSFFFFFFSIPSLRDRKTKHQQQQCPAKSTITRAATLPSRAIPNRAAILSRAVILSRVVILLSSLQMSTAVNMVLLRASSILPRAKLPCSTSRLLPLRRSAVAVATRAA